LEFTVKVTSSTQTSDGFGPNVTLPISEPVTGKTIIPLETVIVPPTLTGPPFITSPSTEQLAGVAAICSLTDPVPLLSRVPMISPETEIVPPPEHGTVWASIQLKVPPEGDGVQVEVDARGDDSSMAITPMSVLAEATPNAPFSD
jgi:hypothetical protein